MDDSVPASAGTATDHQTPTDSKSNFTKRVLFFLGVTTMSAIGGFGAVRSHLERQNNQNNPTVRPDPVAMDSAAALARKALGRATLYAVGGVSVFSFVCWKLIGAKDFEEFRMKMSHAFPRIHRPREPEEIDWDEILNGENNDNELMKTQDKDV